MPRLPEIDRTIPRGDIPKFGPAPWTTPIVARRDPLFGTCRYCGYVGEMTKDHSIPRAYIKTHPEVRESLTNNIVLACSLCNNKKRDLFTHQFLEWLGSDEGRRWLADLPRRRDLLAGARAAGVSRSERRVDHILEREREERIA